MRRTDRTAPFEPTHEDAPASERETAPVVVPTLVDETNAEDAADDWLMGPIAAW